MNDSNTDMLIYTQEILLWCNTFKTAFDAFCRERYLVGNALKEARESADIAVQMYRVNNLKIRLDALTTGDAR